MIEIMSKDDANNPFDFLNTCGQTVRVLDEGEALFLQNAPTAGLFRLDQGVVELSRVTEAGHSIVIHRPAVGEFFAEASLFAEHYHCTATVKAHTVVTLFNRDSVIDQLNSDSNFCQHFIRHLAFQIQSNRRRLELLSIRSANARVLAALQDGLLVDDISSFAKLVALAPETVYRQLANLNKSGQVKKTARGHYRLA